MDNSEIAAVPFAEWMGRVRAGNEDAARELVAKYERAIRVAVRFKLTSPSLRRQFDSMDVCQSVLGSFFGRAAAGQFDLESPEQLVALLIKIAQNKLMMQIRKHTQQKRDVGRVEAMGAEPEFVSREPSASHQLAAREILEKFYCQLAPEERVLAQQRAEGRTWEEIAHGLGQNAQAVRVRLSRAIDRAANDMGLDDLNFDV